MELPANESPIRAAEVHSDLRRLLQLWAAEVARRWFNQDGPMAPCKSPGPGNRNPYLRSQSQE
jgi:hypothetical protein